MRRKRRKEEAWCVKVTSRRTLNRVISALLQELGDNDDDHDEDENDGSWQSLSTYSKTHIVLGAFSHLFLLMNL